MSRVLSMCEAKAAKDDEFYTLIETVEAEMEAYLENDPDVFKDKVILLPCDDPEVSNFVKYFVQNFERVGLKKLIATSKGADGRGRIYTKVREEDEV